MGILLRGICLLWREVTSGAVHVGSNQKLATDMTWILMLKISTEYMFADNKKYPGKNHTLVEYYKIYKSSLNGVCQVSDVIQCK